MDAAHYSAASPRSLLQIRIASAFENENLSIPDLARPGRCRQCRKHLAGASVRDHHLDLYFLQKVRAVLQAAVDLLVTFLPPVLPRLSDGHALNADTLQGHG